MAIMVEFRIHDGEPMLNEKRRIRLSDVDPKTIRKILQLRGRGVSHRRIAAAVGLSHGSVVEKFGCRFEAVEVGRSTGTNENIPEVVVRPPESRSEGPSTRAPAPGTLGVKSGWAPTSSNGRNTANTVYFRIRWRPRRSYPNLVA